VEYPTKARFICLGSIFWQEILGEKVIFGYEMFWEISGGKICF